MEKCEDEEKNILITAGRIVIGKNVSLGKNIRVDIRETFSIGDRSRLGDNARIEGRNALIGSDLWSSSREFNGLSIGRGRKNWPEANFKLGNRCTIHNNTIDLAKEVAIGDDVGLSPDVTIYTHGYWNSVLSGYPAKHAPVVIENGVIVGYRTTILAGVTIGRNAVIGAQSVVTKSLPGNVIYGGNPAKKIRDVIEPSEEEKKTLAESILGEYLKIAEYRGLGPKIIFNFPVIRVNNLTLNISNLECAGEEDEETDDFRDFVFRYGLRFFTKRPFKQSYRDPCSQ